MKIKTILSVLAGAFLAFILFMLLCVVLPPLFLPDAQETPAPALPEEAGERVCSIDDNQQALLWRLRLIQSARQELLLTTFDLQDDESGRDIMAALYDAADRGVSVKIILDGFHAFLHLNNNPRFNTLAAHPGIEVKLYNPVKFLQPWKFNYRMHDKIVISDGQRYLLGGRNTRNVSLGNYQEKQDIDRDILVVSPGQTGSVLQVRDYFESLWTLSDTKPFPGRFRQEAAQVLKDHMARLRELCPTAFTPTDWQAETVPAAVSLLHNPINVGNKVPVLWNQTVSLMENGSDVIVQTPYLICNKRMYEDLTRLSRDNSPLRILLNAPECGANICGVADYHGQKDRLKRTGISLFERLSPRSSHTKTVLLNDRLSLVGSFNFDIRSVHLDTESMLLIDSPQLNAQLRQQVEEDMDRSRSYGPDGTAVLPADAQIPPVSAGKRLVQHILKFVVLPFRHLL